MTKTFNVYHYTYQDVCGDDFYGKEANVDSIGYVNCTEDKVKAVVAKLNEANHSYHASEPTEIDEEFGTQDYLDEDYYDYEEVVGLSYQDFLKSERISRLLSRLNQ